MVIEFPWAMIPVLLRAASSDTRLPEANSASIRALKIFKNWMGCCAPSCCCSVVRTAPRFQVGVAAFIGGRR